MGWLSDELLFYGGMIMAACACIGAVITFSILKIRTKRLDTQLDQEYGPKVKRNKER